ncbi:MAG TPA: hypothetical protein VJ160_04545 [Anaerolineales bacterium]|nr:hypothetical protein [Anaerolineales bacterium]
MAYRAHGARPLGVDRLERLRLSREGLAQLSKPIRLRLQPGVTLHADRAHLGAEISVVIWRRLGGTEHIVGKKAKTVGGLLNLNGGPAKFGWVNADCGQVPPLGRKQAHGTNISNGALAWRHVRIARRER